MDKNGNEVVVKSKICEVEKVEKKNKNKKSKRKKNKSGWGNLDQLYKIGNFIHRTRLYRLTRFWPGLFTQLPAFIYTLITSRTYKKIRKRLIKGYKILYPNQKNIQVNPKRFSFLTLYNQASLLFSLFFTIPNLHMQNFRKFIKTENIESLENSLKKGKGVLIPVIHLGNFFHVVGPLLALKSKPLVVGIANLKHEPIFKDIPIYEHPRLKVIGTTSFSKIKEQINSYLNQNAIILIMIDFSNKKQMRIPFYKKPWDFLIPVPSSVASFSYNSGADIISAITIPIESFNPYLKTLVRFEDPISISNEKVRLEVKNSQKSLEKMEQKKIEYGKIMIRVSFKTNKYLLKYPQFWEEVLNLSTDKISFKIHFNEDLTLFKASKKIWDEINNLISLTYQPEFTGTDLEKDIIKDFTSILENLEKNQDKDQYSGKLKLKNKNITVKPMNLVNTIMDVCFRYATFLEKQGYYEISQKFNSIMMKLAKMNSLQY